MFSNNEKKSFREIHAFCFTLKSNESRKTLEFRYCLNELLVNLHKSAAMNIVFCLTNSGATQYRAGDSLATLKAYASEIEKERNINISLNEWATYMLMYLYFRKTIYCFENESFRYLCAIKSGCGIKYNELQKSLFDCSWNEGMKSTYRYNEILKKINYQGS